MFFSSPLSLLRSSLSPGRVHARCILVVRAHNCIAIHVIKINKAEIGKFPMQSFAPPHVLTYLRTGAVGHALQSGALAGRGTNEEEEKGIANWDYPTLFASRCFRGVGFSSSVPSHGS